MTTVTPDAITPGFRPCPVDDAVLLDADGDGAIVYDERTGASHALNATGGLVWQVFDCDGTIADIAADLSDVFDVDVATAIHQVGSLARGLGAAGLLSGVERPAEPGLAAAEDCEDDEAAERAAAAEPATVDPFSDPPYIAVPPSG